jgi:hypothetical protein
MNKYRRIEVKAYSRRLTIVSGEWPREFSSAKPPHPEDNVSVDDTDLCEPVEPDSPEGQMVLVEAVRSLERRLSPEARETIRARQDTLTYNRKNGNRFYAKLRSFYKFVCPKS